MKRTINYLCILISIFFQFSCRQSDNIIESGYFRGKTVIVDNIPDIESIQGEELQIEDPFMGMISVYDSLMFFYHPRFNDFQYYCINLNSGKLHSKYFGKGKGPNEFLNVTPIFQYITSENGDIVSPFVAVNENQYGLFNLSKSVPTKTTVVDTTYNMKWREDFVNPFIFVFAIDNEMVAAKEQPNKKVLEEERYTPPRFYTFNLTKREPIKEFELFDEFYNKNLDILNETVLLSYDKIDPSRRKIAMAMLHLAQLNILDIETGELKGIRIPNTLNFSDLESAKGVGDLSVYYKSLDVDNEYIYALYVDKKYNEGIDFEYNKADVVHIYDWEGNFVKRLKLDKSVEHIAIDPSNGYLYGADNEDAKVYRFNLKNIDR